MGCKLLDFSFLFFLKWKNVLHICTLLRLLNVSAGISPSTLSDPWPSKAIYVSHILFFHMSQCFCFVLLFLILIIIIIILWNCNECSEQTDCNINSLLKLPRKRKKVRCLLIESSLIYAEHIRCKKNTLNTAVLLFLVYIYFMSSYMMYNRSCHAEIKVSVLDSVLLFMYMHIFMDLVATTSFFITSTLGNWLIWVLIFNYEGNLHPLGFIDADESTRWLKKTHLLKECRWWMQYPDKS